MLRLEFRQSCWFWAFDEDRLKAIDKAPINYPFERHLSVLDPRVLIKETRVKKLTSVLHILVEFSRIHERSCDEVLKEFGQFYDHSLKTDSFTSFNPESNRLDECYHNQLSTKVEWCHLWEIVKQLMILAWPNLCRRTLLSQQRSDGGEYAWALTGGTVNHHWACEECWGSVEHCLCQRA